MHEAGMALPCVSLFHQCAFCHPKRGLLANTVLPESLFLGNLDHNLAMVVWR